MRTITALLGSLAAALPAPALLFLALTGPPSTAWAQDAPDQRAKDERRFVWIPVRGPHYESWEEKRKREAALNAERRRDRVTIPPREESIRLSRAAAIVFHSFNLFSYTSCHSPEELAAVKALEGIPDEDIDGLLGSGESHLIGVGLFLADERQLPKFLLRYPEVLEDTRPSPLVRCSNAWRSFFHEVPDGAPAEGRYQSVAGSLAWQYKEYLTEWYGARPGDESAFYEQIHPDADPWLEVETWRMVASRAIRSEDPERIARVRERMLRAPERVRWLLITGLPGDHRPGGPRPFFTEEEARKALRDLSPEMQQAIRDGRAPLTPRMEKEIANGQKDPAIMRAECNAIAKRLLDGPLDERP